MKTLQLLIIAIMCFVGINTAQAQRGLSCTIDTTCTGAFANVCPTTFAPATAGVFYSQEVTFYFPDTASFVVPAFIPILGGQTIQAQVNSVEVSIDDLPTGLSYDCGVPNCEFTVMGAGGSRYGCAVIYGIPCDPSDVYEITVNFTPSATIAGFQVPAFDIPLPVELEIQGNLPVLEISAITQYLCPSGPGSTIDLEASPGFLSYSWSNGQTDSIATVGAAGQYNVSATHSNGCTLEDSIEIENLNAVVTNDTTICANTFFELNASGGDFFNWSPSANLSSEFANDPLILRGITAPQAFTVTVSNGFCSDSATVNIGIDNSCGLGICTACVLDTVGCAGLTPTVCQQLPVATAGLDYEESFSFFFPGTIDLKALLPQDIKDLIQAQGGVIGIDTNSLPAFPVNQFYIELTDLPTGFSWESDQSGNGNFYYPNKHPSAQYGCITICGESCDVAGEYLDFVVFAEAPSAILNVLNLVGPLLGGALPIAVQGDYIGIPVPITSLTFEYETPLVVTPSGSIELVIGDSITLTGNGGFTGYTWSTGETGTTITVSDAGTYSLSATDANGCQQVYTTEVTVVSGVAELTAFEKSLAIYPNPSNGSFNVTFDLAQNQNVTVEVINLQGQVVNSQSVVANAGANNLPVNMAGVATGVYFVKVQTIDGAITRRVAVQ